MPFARDIRYNSSSTSSGAPYDCIIYASGFEVGTEYRRRAGFEGLQFH